MNKTKITISHSQFLGLVYHSLFDYPLTREELAFWQIGKAKYPSHKVERTGPFFHLPGKASTVLKRALSFEPSEEKWGIAKKAAKLISLIPGIKFVGISGALSMGSAKKEDDIDLFIITAARSLWVSRLFTFLMLKLFKIPFRRFGDREIENRLCINLWVDEESLSFSRRQDVYTAHEILQIKPLVDKGGTYRKFLQFNSWVWEFFPAAREKFKGRVLQSRLSRADAILKLFNRPAFLLQFLYMDKKRTKEVVEEGRALFHPNRLQELVPQLFLLRLEGLVSKKKGGYFQQTIKSTS